MRELWQTGYMHNRVRMVAASFLIKNLLIDWRVGEAWFWDTLVDADPANNAASWQWVAGCGADAAPYFRVFNPVLQAEKFDPKRVYLRRYLGDFDGSDALDYPTPIVDLANARAGALEAFSHVSSLPRDIAPPTGFDSI
jgi:deoxyribodipyrimidine photo-lyase